MSERNVRAAVVIIVAMTLAALLAACGGRSASEGANDGYGRGDAGVMSAPAEMTPGPSPGDEPVLSGYSADAAKGGTGDIPDSDRMVIRSKTMRLEVPETTETIAAIRTLVAEHDGLISDLQVATDAESPVYRYDEQGYATSDGAALRGWVTVRVPVARFDAFVADAMALGTVKAQSEASEDVTQQYVDLSARLENLRAEEARFREFFDAAKTVEEMIAIERELARVRGEIESMDAQVKYLERQTAMATITIELVEPKPVIRPGGEDWGFRDAITAGFRGAANVINGAIAVVIATSPLWIAGIAVFLIARAFVRRHRKRSEAAGSSSAAPDAAPGAGSSFPSDPGTPGPTDTV